MNDTHGMDQGASLTGTGSCRADQAASHLDPAGFGWDEWAAHTRRSGEGAGARKEHRSVCLGWWWAFEPDVGRVAYGVPNGSHRLKALGNSVVPQIPEMIGRAILVSEAAQ